MKKYFVFVALLSAMMLPVRAEVINGTCDNENLTWSYNTDTKTLAFTLTGASAIIPDYDLNKTPWKDYREEAEYLLIPEGVTGIGTYAFHGFEALTEVHMPQSVYYIEQYSFQDCIGLHVFTMGDAVTTIGSHAFSCCYSLTTLAVPNSATDLKYQAFEWVPNVSYADGRMEDCGARCVNGYVENDMVYENNTKRVLAACSAFRTGEVVVDPAVTTVNERAFDHCVHLTSVVFGDGVTTIGRYALDNCPGMESITLGSGITSLPMYSLACKNIQRVYCKSLTPPDASSYTFYGARLENAVLYVPAESIATYQAADVWKEFGSILADTQDIDAVTGNPSPVSHKLLRDGNVYILKGDKTYTLQGQAVR